jgi:EmrB/QacA subfamily drug resistance transporter
VPPEGGEDLTELLDTSVAQGTYRLRWFAAGALTFAALMDLIDTTIVNVALPTIQRDLGASGTQLEWVVSVYLLAFASTLITSGRVGDRLGRRKVFLFGVAGFGIASLACGIAQTPNQLIIARIFQGIFSAVVAPQVLATFRVMFTGKERGRAFAIYGATAGFASGIGLLLGGVLTDANLFGLAWRTIFIVNVPVAIITFIAAVFTVPESRRSNPPRPNVVGTFILIAALIAIVYPLLEGRSLGWPWWCWAMLAAGPLAIAYLGHLDGKRADEGIAVMVPKALFRIPAFLAGTSVYLMLGAGLIGFFLVLALWLQIGQHFSPTRAGLTTISFSLGAIFTAGISVRLATRYGRFVLATGALLMATGFAVIRWTALHATTPIGSGALVPGLMIGGAGLGLLIVPLINVVLSAVPRETAGEASGVFNTAQQLGGAVGVAVIGTVFFGHLSGGVTYAFSVSALWIVGCFVLCAALSMMLPRTAVTDVDA